MFHRASQENPFDLLGAMFIIEGLGAQLAARWGALIKEQLDLADDQVSFLLYHGGNDDRHLDKLEQALGAGALDDRMVDRIVKTAKVTARLYLLAARGAGQCLSYALHAGARDRVRRLLLRSPGWRSASAITACCRIVRRCCRKASSASS